MLTDLPTVFKYHVFVCFQQRPPGHPRGSCSEAGGKPLWDRLQTKLGAAPLPGVAMTATGCLGFCRAGPLMVVYPEGVWYSNVQVADVPELVREHFRNHRPVERLANLDPGALRAEVEENRAKAMAALRAAQKDS